MVGARDGAGCKEDGQAASVGGCIYDSVTVMVEDVESADSVFVLILDCLCK